MNDIEAQIAAWRARMAAALPGQEETVRELEAHLRDHIEVQGRKGISADAALAEGVKKLGEPRAMAREFGRAKLGWFGAMPVLVIEALVGLPVVVILILVTSQVGHGVRSPLMAVHVVAITAGYLMMFGAGLVGLWTLFSGWFHPSTDRELQLQRRELFRLAVAGSVLVPVGMVLGAIWSGTNPPGRVWSWQPVEVGALSVLISTWLLLAVQLRVVASDRIRAVLALLGASVVGIGWFGAQAVTAALPIAWLCGAAIFAQGAIILLQARAKRSGAAAEGERAVSG